MLVAFHEMPSSSRIWIYQANHLFTDQSKKLLTERLNHFMSDWESHGNSLKSSWKIFYDLFLVIAVDEMHHAASGCSIDKSVQLIKQLEIELGTELLEKSSIAVLIEDNSIFTLTIKELKKSIEDGIIKSNSIIFNNLVPTLGELDSNWKLPVEKTWVSKYFNK